MEKPNDGADSFSSKRRNDKVIRNWNDLHKEFLADGVDVRLHKTFTDMYSRMYVIGKYLSSETNRLWAMSMTDNTKYRDIKSDDSIKVDWRSSMVMVPQQENDKDETGRPACDRLVVFNLNRPPHSTDRYIPMCPL